MQTKLEQAKYEYFENVFCESFECPIDIEYSLPDYCPDIQKILKCNAYAQISSYSFSTDRLICEGNMCLYIQYVDEKTGNIRVCEINKEYSLARDINFTAEKFIGKVKASAGHIVCRAINARKLDIHVPVILDAKVTAHKSEMISYDINNLEKKTDLIDVTSAVANITQQFVLENEFNLTHSNPPIESILRRTASVSSLRVSCATGKVVLDGNIDICIMYRSFSDQMSVEKLSYSLPFSQAVEIAGVQSEYIAHASIDVGEFIVQVKEDSMGEYTICQIFIKLFAGISCYKKTELAVICDAYSTDFDSKLSFSNVCFVNLEEDIREKINQKKNLFLADDEVEKILDIWCDNVNVTTHSEKTKMNFRFKYDINLLYVGKSNQVYYISKCFDFSVSREFNEVAQRKGETTARVEIRDFRIVDANNIEVNCEGNVEIKFFTEYSKNILTDAVLSDKTSNFNNGRVCVYYSKKGEELWEIGKKYKASLQSISEINNLTDDVYSGGGALVIF